MVGLKSYYKLKTLFTVFPLIFIVLVYAIREAATGILKQLTEKFGADWAMKQVVPKVYISPSEKWIVHSICSSL